MSKEKANFEKFIVGSDTTEFVNKVRNQVRIRQKRMSNVAEELYRTFNNMGNVYGYNIECSDIESLTLKQMFDVTAQIVHNEEEIYCLDKVVYQKNSWTQLSLINDPVIISLQSTKVYVFSDSVLCLGKVLHFLNATKLGKTELQEYEPRGTTEIMTLSVESRRNSSGIFS